MATRPGVPHGGGGGMRGALGSTTETPPVAGVAMAVGVAPAAGRRRGSDQRGMLAAGEQRGTLRGERDGAVRSQGQPIGLQGPKVRYHALEGSGLPPAPHGELPPDKSSRTRPGTSCSGDNLNNGG